ncbi:MAG: hypothetical protein H6767_00235 [Candidatus Peribacteria bacterium]|nr:MAG: hypothetical protein H6767_00235 [Candidatus Peribacteria bacterium]
MSSCSLHPFEAMKLTKLGDEAYQNEDFIGAETYHKKSYDLSQDEGVLLKLGNDYYADKKYEDAASVYGQVQSQDMQHEAIWWHNLGNTEYRLGEGETDTEKKIQYWKQSIASYEASLAIEEKDTTQENKAFVEEKLKELEEQEQQQSEENKKSGEDTEGWGEQNGDNQEQTGSGETDT